MSIAKSLHYTLPLICALALLSACQSGAPATTGETQQSASAPTTSAAPATVAAPTAAAPTTAAVPATAITSQPTAAPIASATTAVTAPAEPTAVQQNVLLPAPLYVLSNEGQIWRFERDGLTKRQVTFEQSRVLDFDVAAQDGALAYMIGEEPKYTLVLLDASGRTELISGSVSVPLFAPDGEHIAFHVSAPLDRTAAGSQEFAAGVWEVARAGGRPQLIQASDPLTDTAHMSGDERQFFPRAFSPDGSQLLLGGYYPVGEGGFVAVKSLPAGELVRVDDGCCEASWSADGASVLISGGTYIQDAYLGLWRADAATGTSTPLLKTPDNISPLVTGVHQLQDGTLYAFAALSDSAAFDKPNPVMLQRVRPDGTLEPLRPEHFAISTTLWAPDGRGAVVGTDATQQTSLGDLLWVPVDGSAVRPLGIRSIQQRWGPQAPEPRADACGRYRPIAWEAPGNRTARPEVFDLQHRLLALDYRQAGQPDGLYGDQTRAAVSAFQQAAGLSTSGDVDCATWAKLLAGTR